MGESEGREEVGLTRIHAAAPAVLMDRNPLMEGVSRRLMRFVLLTLNRSNELS
jgi:hypothetical protein